MEFENRIKKEMTEGIVRALLDDAGYRVIEYGVEKTAREVTPMTRDQYLRLCLPDSMTKTPDLLVLDRTQIPAPVPSGLDDQDAGPARTGQDADRLVAGRDQVP